MADTDDEVKQLLERTRRARERCNNRMALIGTVNYGINTNAYLKVSNGAKIKNLI